MIRKITTMQQLIITIQKTLSSPLNSSKSFVPTYIMSVVMIKIQSLESLELGFIVAPVQSWGTSWWQAGHENLGRTTSTRSQVSHRLGEQAPLRSRIFWRLYKFLVKENKDESLEDALAKKVTVTTSNEDMLLLAHLKIVFSEVLVTFVRLLSIGAQVIPGADKFESLPIGNQKPKSRSGSL